MILQWLLIPSCGTSPSRQYSCFLAIASIGGPTNICGLTTATYSVSAGVGIIMFGHYLRV